jgi:RNA polymerase sigma-70 factor (ECF subfamily)
VPANDIDPFVRELVRRKARQIIGRAGLTAQDREDVEQELLLRAIRRLSGRDPQQAHAPAFIITVIKHLAANLLRDRGARRPPCSTQSLATPLLTPEGPTDLAAAMGRRELEARLGVHGRSDAELAQLVADAADVLAGLPAELRELAERLKTQSVADIARDMGVPRMTLYQKVRLLRMRFERAGLKDYLEQFPSP